MERLERVLRRAKQLVEWLERILRTDKQLERLESVLRPSNLLSLILLLSSYVVLSTHQNRQDILDLKQDIRHLKEDLKQENWHLKNSIERLKYSVGEESEYGVKPGCDGKGNCK
ncbi:hypothetical protein [Pseudobacteriovorax antillogorgiicola]|uniref:Uncharacterized protein n=1 Tax=Pseudobacteriovorax antillogorgiicola TaxID=1513793 RepID=A0A1Y6BQL9_9BACT|nr:hypothetical protein [Pseudobacteriovorax antillogorgiicola]TCS53700.1 hypothetical protein EDD56_1079 [Pseudobacteriovorax antillogorgiicola]SMF23032.1 hypothetical protein SAMN06296036_107263 [Pseudobacteriovorax antillogorgiicola]